MIAPSETCGCFAGYFLELPGEEEHVPVTERFRDGFDWQRCFQQQAAGVAHPPDHGKLLWSDRGEAFEEQTEMACAQSCAARHLRYAWQIGRAHV